MLEDWTVKKENFHSCDILQDVQERKEVYVYKQKESWFLQVVEYNNMNGDNDIAITDTHILYCPYCGEFLR